LPVVIFDLIHLIHAEGNEEIPLELSLRWQVRLAVVNLRTKPSKGLTEENILLRLLHH
jgi:hypothetical protein